MNRQLEWKKKPVPLKTKIYNINSPKNIFLSLYELILFSLHVSKAARGVKQLVDQCYNRRDEDE